MKPEFSRQIFKKYSNNKFNENLSTGSGVVACGQRDLKKLTVSFNNFANMPKSWFVRDNQ
jgi:hypothetical protein